MAVAVAAGVSITYFTNNDHSQGLLFYLFLILFFVVILWFSITKSVKRQKEIYNSNRLIVKDGSISLYKNHSPNVTLALAEITQISQDKQGNLLIKGKDARQVIAVSAHLENYDQLKDQLQSFHPIAHAGAPNLLNRYPLFNALIPIALMVAAYVSQNKIIVGASGIILIGILIWSFYKIRTSSQIDAKVKRAAWWLLVVIASLVAVIYGKLIA